MFLFSASGISASGISASILAGIPLAEIPLAEIPPPGVERRRHTTLLVGFLNLKRFKTSIFNIR